MGFTGWPAEALAFYEQLQNDNTKVFWQANKPTYDTAVREPMELLMADLDAEQGYGASKIFRPHRDIRFSADKTPYKTAISGWWENGPYVEFSAEGLSVGRGYYMMAKDQLASFRAAVDDDSTGAELEAIRAALVKARIDVTSFDMLKTAPRGYPKDHPRIELLRHKGIVAMRHWDPAKWLHTSAAKKRIVEFTDKSQPLVDWLDANVGPSELEQPGR